jgi:uncharacterized protein (UPF0264 family)
MSFLSSKQKQTALDLIEDAGLSAKELNKQLSLIASGAMDRKSLLELPQRIAAINAQIKAGIGMVGAHMAFTEAKSIPDRLEEKIEKKKVAELRGSGA